MSYIFDINCYYYYLLLPDDNETVVNPSLLSPVAVTRSNSPRLPALKEIKLTYKAT